MQLHACVGRGSRVLGAGMQLLACSCSPCTFHVTHGGPAQQAMPEQLASMCPHPKLDEAHSAPLLIT